MSYVAYYKSTDPKRTMLGGTSRSWSSRFSHREDAELRLAAVIEVHKTLDVPLTVTGEVVEVIGKPEIIRHCGTIAQVAGGICPTCKTRILKETD